METSVRARDGCELFASVLGTGPITIVFSAGLADRMAVRPLGEMLAEHHRVILPDLRGVGHSRCTDAGLHGWRRYTDDVVTLLDHLGTDRAVLAGAGMGSTVALLTALRHGDRVDALAVLGVEAMEIDEHFPARSSAATLFRGLAARVAADGLEATWATLLPTYPPFIRAMVGHSISRMDPAGCIAILNALADDRAFAGVSDLRGIGVPALIIPGDDQRHPADLAVRCAAIIPNGTLAGVSMSSDLTDVIDLAHALAPIMVRFVERAVMPQEPT